MTSPLPPIPAPGPRVGALVAATALVTLGCLAGLLAWAATAPLSSAAIASGEVIVEGRRKPVQHLEGGVIEAILVSEHQDVARDQPIAILSGSAQREQLRALTQKLAEASAHRGRLEAERDGLEAPVRTGLDGIADLPEGQRDQVLRMQAQHMAARKAALDSKIAHIMSQRDQHLVDAEGFRGQLGAIERKLDLARREQEATQRLFDVNSTTVARLREAERLAIEAELARDAALVGLERAKRAALTAELEARSVGAAFASGVLDEIKALDAVLPDWRAQAEILRDDLKRRVVRSPVAGKVLDLQMLAPGSVLPPGGRLMDVVPNEDRAVIEARVNPNDIDLVRPGGHAEVILSAYSMRKVPKLPARVITVAADSQARPGSGEVHYVVRAEIRPEALALLPGDVSLIPGMPIQLFAVGEPRTMLGYLLDPIVQSLGRSMRED